MRLAILAILALVGLAGLVAGARRGRLGSTLATCAAVLVVLWLAAFAAVQTDWRDSDGYLDCWPGCSASQHATGAVVVGAPVVLIVWLAGAAVLARRRS